MTDWIDPGPLVIRVMDFIGFNKKIINYFFYYMIKIDAHKIKY